MMYNNKLVIAIKANGRVLREFKDAVYVPYGSEYSILIKNLNSVRAVVNITIDGQVASGSGLAIEANSEVELKRFLKHDLNKGNAFKFIERTGKIEKHRGVKIDDGLIRVEYQFAKPYVTFTSTTPIWNDFDVDPSYWQGRHPVYRSFMAQPKGISACNFVAQGAMASASASYTSSVPQNEVGITVAGSENNQRFREVADIPMEAEKYVMVIRLLGETGQNEVVRTAITVNYTPTCPTCGTKNKATAKYCIECGTAVNIHSW